MVDPVTGVAIASGFKLVELLLNAAVEVAHTNNIPPEEVDAAYEAITAERKKRAASKLPDV